LPNTFSGFFPGHAAVAICVGFGESTVEVFSLLGGELEGFILFGDAVPEFLDEFELFGGRQLEEFLAKGVRCHRESLPPVSKWSKAEAVVPLVAASSALRESRRQPIRNQPNGALPDLLRKPLLS
jgi:hypothetical protein